MEINPQIALAERYVTETGRSIFLTGKAGTGKTTFLHHIVESCPKRNVVLAPTGVAAVNAGGQTIHSFFQLPLCPYLPDVPELVTEYQLPEQQRKLRKSKIDLLRTLDLVIIDEISMVRADLLDAVDDVLRRYRRSSRPFGGVQLLMIGDVQQLAPVVKDDEKPYMDRVYPSPFFFHSKALQRLAYTTIQLTTIYRQQDPLFVGLLNNIRDGRFDPDTLAALNARVRKKAEGQGPRAENEPILLTTHNYQADRVNQQRLAAIDSPEVVLQAKVEGNFPEGSAPTDSRLVLKAGAQVMFVKNDSSGAHRYYNGKLGTVEEVCYETDDSGDERQVVKVIDEEGDTIHVTPETWENIKYDIDPADNQIRQHVDGTFVQYPLRTAWAITIHKAQGLTFDRVQVDAAAAFTYGQVYVALSRCRSLEGLTLLSPISAGNAFASQDIDHFNTTLTPPQQAADELEDQRVRYYYDVLFELFGFSTLQHEVEALERIYQNDLRGTYPQQSARITALTGDEVATLADVADRFRRQLTTLSQLPREEAGARTAERVAKAAEYFLQQLQAINDIIKPLLAVTIDNKEVQGRFKEHADNYRSARDLKETLLREVRDHGFDPARYHKAKVEQMLSKPKKEPSEKLGEKSVYGGRHADFIPILTAWRREEASVLGVPPYFVLQQKSLLAIADTLPTTVAGLRKVPGIGKAKIQQYGAELLQLVDDYRHGYV